MPFSTIADRANRRVRNWDETQEAADAHFSGCKDITTVELEKIRRIINTFLEVGHFPKNETKFKRVENEQFYAIKSHQVRLYGLLRGSEYIIFCAKRKRDTKISRKNIKMLRIRCTLCTEEIEKHGK